MDENSAILIIVLVVLGYGYFSKLLYRFNISGPMVFAAIGIFLSPLGIGTGETHLDAGIVQITAEITLIIVLFSDASGLQLKNLKFEWNIPARLLFIGLPITIVLSALLAKEMFPAEMTTYLLLMALILAPTDAALGKAVVTDKKVPEKIRSSINVESGLNDGIVFPILITVALMIVNGQTHAQDNQWITYIIKQITLGAIIGAMVGYLNAKLSSIVFQKNWMEKSYKNLIPIALAILSYYVAEHFGGNGYIAAFFSGLLVGNYNEELREHIEDFAESEGELLILISFLVFGVVFIPATIAFWNTTVLIYAVMSLTLLRMVPVAISLIGLRLGLPTILFIGWFGPRGIASILYVLIVVHKIGPIKGHETIYAVITVTILLSIILHGLSAQPLARLYGKKFSTPAK